MTRYDRDFMILCMSNVENQVGGQHSSDIQKLPLCHGSWGTGVDHHRQSSMFCFKRRKYAESKSLQYTVWPSIASKMVRYPWLPMVTPDHSFKNARLYPRIIRKQQLKTMELRSFVVGIRIFKRVLIFSWGFNGWSASGAFASGEPMRFEADEPVELLGVMAGHVWSFSVEYSG